jgi:transcriptional regulator with XRE-family HTH domain
VQVQVQRMSKLLSIEFGLALRDARLRAGLTQTDVAKRARVSQTYVSQVELGEQNVTLASMARLARAVGLDVSLGITDDDHTLSRAHRPLAFRASSATRSASAVSWTILAASSARSARCRASSRATST